MNLATAITTAIKHLRRHGQSVTQDHLLYVLFSATNQNLIVSAFKPGEESIAVRIPFEVNEAACGVFPASFKDLFIQIQDMPHDWIAGSDDRGDFLNIQGANFQYRFDLKDIAPRFSKIYDTPLDSPIVYDVIISTTTKQKEPDMSAYIVSDDCINTIVSAAIDFGMIDVAEAQAWAQTLATENVRSVNYRYSEDNEFPIEFEQKGDVTKTIALGCIGELRYQSCEHGAWDESEACEFLDSLESAIKSGSISSNAIESAKQELTKMVSVSKIENNDAYGDLLNQWKSKKTAAKVKKPSKLDVLVAAMREGVTDVDVLVERTGMKPGGVKAWMGVIQNQGIDNWKKSVAKAA